MSRPRRICSKSAIDTELSTLQELFVSNGSLMSFVKILLHASKKPVPDDPRRPIVIRLPWMGDRISGQINQDIAKVVSKVFPNVKLIVSFTTRRSFSGIAKDALPTTALNNVIYKYTCHCQRTYVGKT